MLRRHSFLVCLAVFLGPACAPRTPVPSASKGASSVVTAPVASSAVPPKDNGYDVHEWGLVREDLNATLRVGAAPPPREQEALSIDKPVLYFHAAAPLMLKQVSVEVPGGKIVETWPIAQREGAVSSWFDVSVDPFSACKPSPLPRKSDPPCSKLKADDPCESLGLAQVRTVDASCVRVGGATETFLFYRGSTARVTPPLRFEKDAKGNVTVENEGDLPIPGYLVRIETTGRATRTLSVRPPAPHQSVVVAPDFPPEKSISPFAHEEEAERQTFRGEPPPQTVTGPAREQIRASMRENGLNEAEADAFMKSWDETLFGVVLHHGSPAPDPVTTFLYWLPESSIAGYATVAFDPPPRSFRRALAVWTRLSPNGGGH